ncbi:MULTISPECIES: ribosome silencing factor [Janibacter]|uniref:ribosome silencing factor n=1 Tax=Janibacter TaxID=53457 RepID=UPI0017865F4C|nr:ribosome silencing factor [Janibacter melonis]MBD5829995.1 ribosome silencing factor [Janibacter melonis]
MTASTRAVELATVAARAAEDKIAESVVALDVSGQMPLTDIFLIVSADNERQVASIVDAVEDALRDVGAKRLRREGARESRWVLLDFGDVVVHVQHEEERAYYELERLWRDCPVLDLQTGAPAAGASDETTDPS